MKRYVLSAIMGLLGLMASCRSSEMTADPTPMMTTMPGSTTTTTVDTTGQTSLARGTFMSNVHPTSGTVSVVQKGGKQTLVFTNFKTDGGPDLRIYLAENTGLRNFIEVSRLPGGGNFSVDLPAEADPTKQRYVLIWCKAFSVLFGNAELK
ncbi:DM13 domain-containing protein [Fibrella aquatica]|jgi:Electron transfer DM13|uniref:DM13 domain-containing protein n=1 Tax=Fibrella aquatica TaxID=3242487 RepID=UPI003521571F